jgi:hypothetical protein
MVYEVGPFRVSLIHDSYNISLRQGAVLAGEARAIWDRLVYLQTVERARFVEGSEGYHRGSELIAQELKNLMRILDIPSIGVV